MGQKWDACIDCGCAKINRQRKQPRCRSCGSKEALNRPEVKVKLSAASKEVHNRPEVIAKLSATSKEVHNRPEVKARHCAAAKEVQNRSEVRIKNSISHGGDGDLERLDRERKRQMRISEYKLSARGQWAKSVKVRDRHTCQHCGETNKKILHAHHIKPKAMFPELALEIDNGLTLCQPCHLSEHRRIRPESIPVGGCSRSHRR
jgi:5-methylcytosine-specific restriction endonuclease McrA